MDKVRIGELVIAGLYSIDLKDPSPIEAVEKTATVVESKQYPGKFEADGAIQLGEMIDEDAATIADMFAILLTLEDGIKTVDIQPNGMLLISTN